MPFASVPESIASPVPEIKVSNSPHPVAAALPSPVALQPVQPKEDLTDEEEAATPATTSTTTTNTSSASQSPREEVVERSKSPAESSEVDLDCLSEQQKPESLDVESSEMTQSTKPRSTATTTSIGLKRKAPPSDVGSRSPMHGGKRKRRTRDAVVGRGRGGRGRHGSDRFIKGDDDFDDGDDHHHKNVANMPSLNALDNDALAALAQRSPNSKKYNFFVDLGEFSF
jgi:hypothetical protein